MKFNRNKLVVHRIFFSRPGPCLIWGRLGGLTGLTGKNRAFIPKRQVCSTGNGERLGESSMSATRCPACHTIVLGSRRVHAAKMLHLEDRTLENASDLSDLFAASVHQSTARGLHQPQTVMSTLCKLLSSRTPRTHDAPQSRN